MRNVRKTLLGAGLWALCWLLGGPAVGAEDTRAGNFCSQWRFLRADEPGARAAAFDDSGWESVTLPHTAHIEALVAGQAARQWQGICWYRKTFELHEAIAGKKVFLDFEGAMNAASVWVNGRAAGEFMGGYLPYVRDISKLVVPGGRNVIAVRLDNRDNPMTGPKPLAELDFNLYRGVVSGCEAHH